MKMNCPHTCHKTKSYAVKSMQYPLACDECMENHPEVMNTQNKQKTECNCHCHHTAQNLSDPNYLNQPNWAECPFGCEESCIHCQKPQEKCTCEIVKEGGPSSDCPVHGKYVGQKPQEEEADEVLGEKIFKIVHFNDYGKHTLSNCWETRDILIAISSRFISKQELKKKLEGMKYIHSEHKEPNAYKIHEECPQCICNKLIDDVGAEL